MRQIVYKKNNMIIGIDGNEANLKNRVGVNQYAFELLKHLYILLKDRKDSNNPIEVIIFLKEKPIEEMPPQTKFWKYRNLPGKHFWILTKLTPYLIFNSKKINLFFAPSHYLPFLAPVPKVCSIMDLGYLEFSEQFKKYDFWQLKYWSAISIVVAKKIIAISEATKNDIVRHYPFASKKVFVTYPAYDDNRFKYDISENDVRHVKNKYHIVGDYLLFLSTLKPSKNVEGVIDAFNLIHITNDLKLNFNNLKLVISGKKGWFYEKIFEKVRKLNLEREVIFTDFVPEEDKPQLLKGAKVFISPSYWEGFGLHVLEAMACGIPCVVTRSGSLPEITQDTGVYVETGGESIAKGVLEILSLNKVEYKKLSLGVNKKAKLFSWEKCAEETLNILVNNYAN